MCAGPAARRAQRVGTTIPSRRGGAPAVQSSASRVSVQCPPRACWACSETIGACNWCTWLRPGRLAHVMADGRCCRQR
eukprot:7187719-Prymnesium_polylepis.3